MDNAAVNTLWIDHQIGVIQKICYCSYLEQGHMVNVYSYQEIGNLPPGVVWKDANGILDQSLVFKDLRNSYATFSDWFRIALLYKNGGWWVDSDTICLKKFNIKDDFAFATEVVDAIGNVSVCNAIIKMPANSSIGNAILNEINEIITSKDVNSILWTEIGASILNRFIHGFGLEKHLLSPEVFCPIHYFNFKEIFQRQAITFPKSTYAVHVWNKMWEWGGIDPENDFGDMSFFQDLKRKYIDT